MAASEILGTISGFFSWGEFFEIELHKMGEEVVERLGEGGMGEDGVAQRGMYKGACPSSRAAAWP